MKPSDGSLDPTQVPEISGHGETLADTESDDHQNKARPSTSGYQLGELLGRGGMGEVVLADDLRIGRQVAVKRMRSASPTPEATARFLREAKIQARLDHPAIVPVHELGHDADGRPFFTMKRLSGTTLAEVLANRNASLQKLLRVLVEVCQAIEFAHARGVIHRDLKPANIMLGEYGEVYVLDWGVARVVGDHETNTSAGIESLEGQTQAGAVLGTPGYMSPEQVRGESITTAIDVYALGSMLFEVLSGEPVHPRGHTALIATLAGSIEPPSTRAPDRPIAPELDSACVAALAFEAADRPTAGGLADQIQRYLDGDRDLERRRTLAAEQLTTARAAIASADPGRRAEAMRAAGRALALDPESEAATLVSKLMIEPPSNLPAELEARLAAIDHRVVSTQAGLGARAMLVYLTIVPMALWMGIKDWRALAISLVLLAVNILYAAHAARSPGRQSMMIATIANAAFLLVLGRIFGPFVFLPGLLVGACTAMITLPPLLPRPVFVIGAFSAAFVVPIVLELGGVLESTWNVVDHQLIVMSPMVDLQFGPATLFLILGGVSMLFVTPLFVRTLAIMSREARRGIEIQAWHLEQLLPKRG